MDARIQALPFDPAALRGLSEKLLTSHHQNNYGGAVKRLNAITAQLQRLDHTMLAGLTHPPVVELSERLAALTGLGHPVCMRAQRQSRQKSATLRQA